jgi:sulfite reductase (ferredoxin)
MSTNKVEEIKEQSRGLRGHLAEELAAGGTHFAEDSTQLLKFHGSYQQDDRDVRNERKKAGLEKHWQFMIRSKIAGGDLSVEQYLAHDRMADELGNGTIRLTNRQGIQMHGILFGSLKDCIQRINTCGLTTRGACGDIVRNTMATAMPLHNGIILEAQQLAMDISDAFYAKTHAYSEIWLDGEKVNDDTPDPFYGEHFLPRKYKIGIAVPPHNDIDVFTQDTGLVPHIENAQIVGYTIFVGGGFGMSFGQHQTHPVLSKPLLYVDKAHALEAVRAIVSVQRDFGRRDDRKQARLKYLIRDKGLDWFRERVLERVDFPTEEPRPVRLETVEDILGWNAQGDGKFFYGLWVPEGRIQDSDSLRLRSAIRLVCDRLAPKMRITPNTNLYFYDLDESLREPLEAILHEHGAIPASALTRARRVAHACVALPTCGLALAESERVFGGLMREFDKSLDALGLREEPILIRMSGCPNGCPRPYNADIAFVGRSPGKYALYVGGSYRGDRLAGLSEKTVPLDELPTRVHALLEDFAQNRQPGESFSDYFGRTQQPGEAPSSEQFHVELAARAAARAKEKPAG